MGDVDVDDATIFIARMAGGDWLERIAEAARVLHRAAYAANESAELLLDILACPNCHSALRADDEASELVCTNSECALAYPVRDDIPVLLVDEARRPGVAAGDTA